MLKQNALKVDLASPRALEQHGASVASYAFAKHSRRRQSRRSRSRNLQRGSCAHRAPAQRCANAAAHQRPNVVEHDVGQRERNRGAARHGHEPLLRRVVNLPVLKDAVDKGERAKRLGCARET